MYFFPLSYSFYTLKHLKSIDKIYFTYDSVKKRNRILNCFRVMVNKMDGPFDTFQSVNVQQDDILS